MKRNEKEQGIFTIKTRGLLIIMVLISKFEGLSPRRQIRFMFGVSK